LTISYEVIVIGGGAIGAACARELARSGRKILVLERGTDEGASWRAAAGMLAPQIEAGEADPLFELGLAGRERYADLAGELKESTGIDIQFWQEGIARLATEEAEVAPLRSRVAWQRQQGHLSDWFDAEEVRSRWPWLGPSHGALWAAKEAALDPASLVRALIEDARLTGATILTEKVRGIERRGDRVIGVAGASQKYSADHVVIAAGAWAPGLTGLPRPLPIVPVRGQMASFPWPRGIERAIVFGGQGYVVARGGEAITGSTMEHAGFDAEVTSAGLASIFTGATALCPALSSLEVTRTWAGLRPVTPDGLPIVGREPGCEGLWYATGHGRNGILLAAITGLLITQLINGEPPEEDLRAIRPERFFNW
jgi:glycine oxidase